MAAAKKTYKPPQWSRVPNSEEEEWWLAAKRGEQVIEYVSLNGENSFFFGRMEDNHHIMRHPTTSRYHCIIQHGKKDGENSVFAHDQSTHGTFVNNDRLKKLEYIKLKKGDKIRFGQSSRHYELCFQDPKVTQKRKREDVVPPINVNVDGKKVAHNAPTPKNVVITNSWGTAFKKSTLSVDNDPNKTVSKLDSKPAIKPKEAVRKFETNVEGQPPTKKLKIIENLQKRIKKEGASQFSMFAGKDTVSEQEAYFNQMRGRQMRGRGFSNRQGF